MALQGDFNENTSEFGAQGGYGHRHGYALSCSTGSVSNREK
jgi:hypothetical protein